jgi:ribonuclease PH
MPKRQVTRRARPAATRTPSSSASGDPGGGKEAPSSAAPSRSTRADGRRAAEARRLRIAAGYLDHAEGSALVTAGGTRVLCAVSIEDDVPEFLRGKGRGWLTAEYSMLPRATHTRSQRESSRGKVGGRTHEIQRLIGRSLRAVVDLAKLGERTLFVDCDVLQADGGTRTAAINGAYVAVAQAIERLVRDGVLPESPLREPVGAISVGLVDGALLVDLAYGEDSRAEVDANFVMTGSGGLVEVQGTAEGRTFGRDDLVAMLDAAWAAIQRIHRVQEASIAGVRQTRGVKRPARKAAAKRAPARKAAAKRPPARKAAARRP